MSVLSDCYVILSGRPPLDFMVVDLVPCCVCFMLPMLVASSTPIHLLISWASIPGHPFRYPALAASIKVVLV